MSLDQCGAVVAAGTTSTQIAESAVAFRTTWRISPDDGKAQITSCVDHDTDTARQLYHETRQALLCHELDAFNCSTTTS